MLNQCFYITFFKLLYIFKALHLIIHHYFYLLRSLEVFLDFKKEVRKAITRYRFMKKCGFMLDFTNSKHQNRTEILIIYQCL